MFNKFNETSNAHTYAPAFDVDMSRQMEYEQRPFEVHCDLCPATDKGSERDLRAKGWHLGRGFEFCPSTKHD